MVPSGVRGKDPGVRQTRFAGLEHAGKKRRTGREKFTGEMDRVVP